MIRQYIPSDKPFVHTLWNTYAPKDGYCQLTSAEFDELILGNAFFRAEFMQILLHDNERVGFALGACDDELPAGRERGYLACLILDGNIDFAQNADLLLTALECAFVNAGRQTSDVLFFSPFHLPWLIPDTQGHRHNNAPGVFTGSALHKHLLLRGYIERAKETAMHLSLDHFALSEPVTTRLANARKKDYDVCLYSSRIHTGLAQMLGALGNPLWEKEILAAGSDNLPFLVAVHECEIVGFAGPIYPEPSGRGYFTGMGVVPQHEGLGLGTVLFHMLCREEAAKGATYMSLFTGEKNPAKRIYEGTGFTDKRSFAIMRKALKPKED